MRQHPTTQALLESWELALHVGKSPRTVELYLAEGDRFGRWLADHDRPEGAPGDLSAVDRQDAEAWIGDLRSRGLAQATIRSRWIALRNFYNWAVEEDEIAASPLERVKVERAATPPATILDDDEIAALLAACAGSSFYDRRDHALIRFLLASGLRVSECCALTVEDLDLRQRVAVVRQGKGGDPRFARFDAATAASLDRYRRSRARHRYARSVAFWIGHRGALTRKGIPSMLERRGDAAGIGHIHAHQLRHTWAHRAKRSGMSDEDLQRLGGWADASVMRRYGEANAVERALDAYDRHSPLGDL